MSVFPITCCVIVGVRIVTFNAEDLMMKLFMGRNGMFYVPFVQFWQNHISYL